MTAPRDKFGRPIVVVTGMGIVTSLGAGKTDNWAKLTAGESGIRTITRFPDRRPEDDDGRNRRFRHRRAVLVDRSHRTARRNGDRGSARSSPASAPRAIFRDRCFSRWRRSKSNGRSGMELGRAIGKAGHQLRRPAAHQRRRKIRAYHHRFMFGSVAAHLAETFGTKGSPISLSTACASGATAIQLGVEAIRRGETDAALCVGDRRHRSIRKRWCGSRCCRRCRPRTIRRRPPQSRSRRTATASSWRKAPARWCWKATKRRWRAARRSSASLAGCGELTDSFHRTRSSPDGKPIIGCVLQDAGGCRHDAGTDRPHQRARHLDAGKRQDGISRRSRRCSASAPSRFRYRRTNRWSATPSRRRARWRRSSRC